MLSIDHKKMISMIKLNLYFDMNSSTNQQAQIISYLYFNSYDEVQIAIQ